MTAAIAGLVARLRSVWRDVRRGSALHADMDEEFRLHLDLRAADLERAGLAPAEARRRARLEFGSTERYKDEGRESRGLRGLDALRLSWLDFKLGFRMLARYPGLTLVGGLAIAFAIAVGAGSFEFATQVMRPTLPLDGGDRIVAVRQWDAVAGRAAPSGWRDLDAWREGLASIDELGAYRTIERNLVVGEGALAEPVAVAEISAAAFRIAHVPPLLGRALVEADERAGAPAVLVIGHDAWLSRFGADSGVVGRTVRLGSVRSIVVGVMPEGFAFPVAHSYWTPLRSDVLAGPADAGPALTVFGRLAPGATLERAQAEAHAAGLRRAADAPSTHRNLRPRIQPYARSVLDPDTFDPLVLLAVNVFLVMLLVLVCGNVALLMFARAATRESELAVRSALGASRGRIILQLFTEALVLAGLGTIAGLAAAGLALRSLLETLAADGGERLPFWLSASLSPTTIAYAAALAVLGAVVMGVVPALKVTRGLAARLRQAAVGRPPLKFGGVWTAVIVTQVALTVAFPATAFFVRDYVERMRTLDVGFPTGEYLAVRLELDRETAADPSADSSAAALRERLRTTYRELERRVAAEPGVTGVTFVDRLPRTLHSWRPVQVDGPGVPRAAAEMAAGSRRRPGPRCAPALGRPCASLAAVDPDYFDVIGAPILSGRGFRGEDLESGVRVVIVNRSFVREVLGGRNPIGLRLRYADSRDPSGRLGPDAEPNPWHEIVGVVPDLGMIGGEATENAGIYHPAVPGHALPLHMLVHVRGAPASLAPRLRTLGAEVDPALRLHDLQRLDQAGSGLWLEMAFLFRLLLVVSAVAVVLSLAGIYSVMAFTVSRRTREIGIRIALGANAYRVIAAIFARPLAQVGLGLAGGAGLVLVLTRLTTGLSGKEVAMIAAYMVLMLAVCLLACIVPTHRALRVAPTEALRTDG